MKIDLSHEELSTVLAALRTYQKAGYGEPENRPLGIHDIAEDGGECVSLNDDGIDELCTRLNLIPEFTRTPEVTR